MKSLEIIGELRDGNLQVLKENPWLRYLYLNEDNKNINIERYKNISAITNTSVLNYVEETLSVLDKIETKALNIGATIEPSLYRVIEEVLCWSEVAKGGNSYIRNIWLRKGYPLEIHNESSALIYKESNPEQRLPYLLIKTHGLIGQSIRGECKLSDNKELLTIEPLFKEQNYSFKDFLLILNWCITAPAVNYNPEILELLKNEIDELLSNGKDDCNNVRIKKLRKGGLLAGEDEVELDGLIKKVKPDNLEKFLNCNLWYIESATSSLSLEEFMKLISISGRYVDNSVKNITFKNIMNDLFYDYKGIKTVNLYKKRIIEKYLKEVDIYSGNIEGISNEHIKVEHKIQNGILSIEFKYSNIASKLIDFCIEAEGNGAIYDKAIIMLYDLFGFRRDKYDRFHNEDNYLSTMNESLRFKAPLLNYIKGKTVLDVGPGGGALMDLIEERYPTLNVKGIDISKNVVENLNKRKHIENKKWDVLLGDALNLKDTFHEGEISTVILSSIIHELYSYIPFNGKRFNHDTIKQLLLSIYDILPIGGRILIRDGIMTEDKNLERIIEFKDLNDINILTRYCNDFKGRKISFTQIDDNKVKMKINDAMEFLYTYTWGEESYAHEINEQFGYFTPNEYRNFVKDILGDKINIIYSNNYLQEGYTKNLLSKISFYDNKLNEVSLPDSTFILILEKAK